ncbi:MAG: hypothetical protein MPW14_09575 [Candidatus Manganitrophus sp.]|nr:MAG: hypothetical protein MPW14_09575 [Candidatus Manganitrophus sp.]
MSKLNVVQAINQALRHEMERNPDLILMGEDIGKDGGVFRVTEGLIDQFGERRVVDTPFPNRESSASPSEWRRMALPLWSRSSSWAFFMRRWSN